MEASLRALVGEARAGRADAQRLGLLGDADPERAADDLKLALDAPDLGPCAERWLPGLLLSARPGSAARHLTELAERYRQTRRAALPPAAAAAAVRVLGASDALARVLLRHPHWVEDLDVDPLPPPPADAPVEPDWTAIRIAKYRGLLRIAARDLAGRPFGEGLRELSDLADRCLSAGLARASHDTHQDAPAMLALGKLGGRELNFSSDVDLLFLYDPGDAPFDPDRHEAYADLVRHLKTHMEVPSEDGFGYRVDLDLRPEGRVGALVQTLDSALTYYESFGAEWERQMLIRLRALGGERETADVFVDQTRPFVYRRLIAPGAIAGVRDMKLRIEAERRSAGRDLEIQLKEGPGGIRDVEFLVQALQLFHGGRERGLRTGNVLDALAVIGDRQLLPADVVEGLRDAYLWLRRAEHCVQMVEERQTQEFPRKPAAQVQLARRMGYPEIEGSAARNRMLDDWTKVRTTVRAHFDALVLRTDL